jgi:AcrR family transcriptional regulator
MTNIIEGTVEDLGLRERKKQQTRNAIHEAAFRLIEEQGLEATTIDQICHEADVSTRTFFNYFPSKAAAALELPGTVVDAGVQARFRDAEGGLVAALCDAIGSNADLGPRRAKIKQLVMRRPELLTTLGQVMTELRGQFIALAAERASSTEQAELAVALVMAALGRVMHDESDSDAPLAERLRNTVAALLKIGAEELAPAEGIA